MGVRSGVAVALVASALLGLTVAVPQDAHLGASGSSFRFLTGKGANVGDGQLVHGTDGDVGSLLDRIDGRTLDPNLLKNLDRAALADLLDQMTPEQLRTLGLDEAQAASMAEALRDPDLDAEALAGLVGLLADRGLSFLNANGDGRFNGGEEAFADLDGDGRVSQGDVRLGILALLVSQDRGLAPEARSLLEAFQAAGGVGLANPFGALGRANATAATAPLEAPLPYPTDRAGGPLQPVCVQLYTPSLTCHQRTFVQERVTTEGNHYLFNPAAQDSRAPLAIEPEATGVRSKGTLHLRLDPEAWTPVPALTPSDRLVSIAGASLELARDGNGMVWARGEAGEAVVTLVWAIDPAYYDLTVPPSVTAQDVPAALQPVLGAEAQAVGLRIAAAAGADGRGYGGGLRALAQHLHSFGAGALPDRDERADDLLAVVEAQVGCARQRSAAFVLGAQALGIPARLVVNEAHVFAEAYVPQAGWRMVDLGGCGQYQVAALPGHAEVLVRQNLPFAPGQRPPSQSSSGEAGAAAAIDITESPASLRRNSRFTIAGTATSPAGPVPDGVPVTFTYNRTKTSPGTAFCAGQTAGGGYRATCQLGPDTPGGSLQLVARLAPTLVAGRPSEAAYSDPPFTLQKATRLAVEGPARTAADVPLAYVARLVDEDGLPVPYVLVALRLDDGPTRAQATDRDGRALFHLQAEQGEHRIAARFAGDDGHDPTDATFDLVATAARLTAAIDREDLEQGRLSVAGTLEGTGQKVEARWRSSPDAEEQVRAATTDAKGAYRITFDGPAPAGLGLVTVQAADGTGVGAGFVRTVRAVAALDVPPRWKAGSAVPLTIRLLEGNAILPLKVLVDGEETAQATARPDAATTVLVDLLPGDHTLDVRAEPGMKLISAPQPVRVGPLQVELDPVPVLSPGGRLDLAGRLLFEGEPVSEALTLRVLDAKGVGRSGADGRFHVSLLLPPNVPVGRAAAVLEGAGIGLQEEVGLRVQRAARLVVDAPGLSFNAFGATPIAVRGEGTLRVRVDGELADPGIAQVATRTLLLRTVRIEAVALPTGEGVAPASETREILVVNPLTLLGVPSIAITGTVVGVRVRQKARLARDHRYRFLLPPQAIPARLLRPDLPPAVPRILDPAEDDAIELRMRRKGPWLVRDGRGHPVAATVDGRAITIPVAALAPGLHQLRLERGKRAILLPVAVQPLRGALDDATRRLVQRLQGSDAFVTMEALESSLTAAGADPAHAQEVRQVAEHGLYAGPRCDRAAFHAFFAALDRAQAGA